MEEIFFKVNTLTGNQNDRKSLVILSVIAAKAAVSIKDHHVHLIADKSNQVQDYFASTFPFLKQLHEMTVGNAKDVAILQVSDNILQTPFNNSNVGYCFEAETSERENSPREEKRSGFKLDFQDSHGLNRFSSRLFGFTSSLYRPVAYFGPVFLPLKSQQGENYYWSSQTVLTTLNNFTQKAAKENKNNKKTLVICGYPPPFGLDQILPWIRQNNNEWRCVLNDFFNNDDLTTNSNYWSATFDVGSRRDFLEEYKHDMKDDCFFTNNTQYEDVLRFGDYCITSGGLEMATLSLACGCPVTCSHRSKMIQKKILELQVGSAFFPNIVELMKIVTSQLQIFKENTQIARQIILFEHEVMFDNMTTFFKKFFVSEMLRKTAGKISGKIPEQYETPRILEYERIMSDNFYKRITSLMSDFKMIEAREFDALPETQRMAYMQKENEMFEQQQVAIQEHQEKKLEKHKQDVAKLFDEVQHFNEHDQPQAEKQRPEPRLEPRPEQKNDLEKLHLEKQQKQQLEQLQTKLEQQQKLAREKQANEDRLAKELHTKTAEWTQQKRQLEKQLLDLRACEERNQRLQIEFQQQYEKDFQPDKKLISRQQSQIQSCEQQNKQLREQIQTEQKAWQKHTQDLALKQAREFERKTTHLQQEFESKNAQLKHTFEQKQAEWKQQTQHIAKQVQTQQQKIHEFESLSKNKEILQQQHKKLHEVKQLQEREEYQLLSIQLHQDFEQQLRKLKHEKTQEIAQCEQQNQLIRAQFEQRLKELQQLKNTTPQALYNQECEKELHNRKQQIVLQQKLQQELRHKIQHQAFELEESKKARSSTMQSKQVKIQAEIKKAEQIQEQTKKHYSQRKKSVNKDTKSISSVKKNVQKKGYSKQVTSRYFLRSSKKK